MRPFLPIALAVLTAGASAQAPPPAPVLGVSGLDCTAGRAAPFLVSEASAAPIVRLDLEGLAPAPLPNVCAEATPRAVLPEGRRFRLDPLPPSSTDDLGRQLLREHEQDRVREQDRLLRSLLLADPSALRPPIRYPGLEPILQPRLVAPTGERP